MPPELTARERKQQRLRKEANEIEALKATGSDTLGEAIEAAIDNPYTVVETSFKAAVKTYLGQPASTRKPKTRAAAKRKGKGNAAEINEDDDEDEDGQATALDIEWTAEQEEFLDQAKSENPKLAKMNQNHKSLYKTVFRFMHCLPSDIVGPKTFLEFDSSLAASNQWTMHFCTRLGELVPQPLFRGSPAKLALAIQWAVICRTDDRRKYRLSGCADDGFLQCLTAVIAEKQDGTKTCVKLRKAAVKLYREKYPGEGFEEPLWCQLFRHIEERTFPDGEPLEKAQEGWDDPYLVHTEHLTTVYISLNQMQHLSLRMFTDSDTVHATAELSRRFNDRPLLLEAEKAWEAHLITWQQEKASRGIQLSPPSSDSPSPSGSPSHSDSDFGKEASEKATRKTARKTAKDKPNERASLVGRRRRGVQVDASDSLGEDSNPPAPPRSSASSSPVDHRDYDNDDGAFGGFGDDEDNDIRSQQGQDARHSPSPHRPISLGDSDRRDSDLEDSDFKYSNPEHVAPRRRKRTDSKSEPPPRHKKRQRRRNVVDSSSDNPEPSQSLQQNRPLTRNTKTRGSSQIISDSMGEDAPMSGVADVSPVLAAISANLAASDADLAAYAAENVSAFYPSSRAGSVNIANERETSSEMPISNDIWCGHDAQDSEFQISSKPRPMYNNVSAHDNIYGACIKQKESIRSSVVSHQGKHFSQDDTLPLLAVGKDPMGGQAEQDNEQGTTKSVKESLTEMRFDCSLLTDISWVDQLDREDMQLI